MRNNLAKLLIDKGMKQTELSERTGIARSTLSKIHTNQTQKVELKTPEKILNVLEGTPNEFFDYKQTELGKRGTIMNNVITDQAILISEQSDKLEDIKRQIEEWIRGGNQTTALDNIANILNIESEDK